MHIGRLQDLAVIFTNYDSDFLLRIYFERGYGIFYPVTPWIVMLLTGPPLI